MASCSYILTLGKRHPRFAPSTYKTCITPTQAKELFGSDRKPRPLGCGVYACVFEHKDAGKVVKITRDSSDVAGLLQGQGLEQVPKVYAHHKLVGRPRWTTPRPKLHPHWQEWPEQPEAFALVVEKLRVFTGSEKSKWNQRIRRLETFQIQEAQKRALVAAGGGKTEPARPDAKTKTYRRPMPADAARAVCPKKPYDDCEARMRELIQMKAALASRGIEWHDLHAGNIGLDSRGRLKALDLGASPTPLDRDVPELAGRRRQR